MLYPAYYITLLNYIDGRSLDETSPPDSMTDNEKMLAEQASSQLMLLTDREIPMMTSLLKCSLFDLYTKLKRAHDLYEPLARHNFVLHDKETLWMKALDKALPDIQSAIESPWSDNGAWRPFEFDKTIDGAGEFEYLHVLLIALIEFSVRELGRGLP